MDETILVVFSVAKMANIKPNANPTPAVTAIPSFQDETSANCHPIGLTRAPTKNPPGKASTRFSSAVFCAMDFRNPIFFTIASSSLHFLEVDSIHPPPSYGGLRGLILISISRCRSPDLKGEPVPLPNRDAYRSQV